MREECSCLHMVSSLVVADAAHLAHLFHLFIIAFLVVAKSFLCCVPLHILWSINRVSKLSTNEQVKFKREMKYEW